MRFFLPRRDCVPRWFIFDEVLRTVVAGALFKYVAGRNLFYSLLFGNPQKLSLNYADRKSIILLDF